MRIYVTGIAGMLGFGIYKTLKYKASIFGNDIVEVKIPDLSYSKISLLDKHMLEADIVEKNPDVLIHTAAMVNVEECEEKPEAAKKLNTEITMELVELCRKYKIKMVYISTDAVFDGKITKLYSEEDTTSPINVYGMTKLEGEYSVLKYPTNLVFRTNIYGVNIQYKKSFGEWIYYSLRNNQTLNMFSDIDFSPILVDELAELIYHACDKNLSGLYHACGTGCITKYDFAVKMKEIFKINQGRINKSTSDMSALKAKRSKHMGMSNRKLCEELKIKISTPVESIQKFHEIIKSEERIWK